MSISIYFQIEINLNKVLIYSTNKQAGTVGDSEVS